MESEDPAGESGRKRVKKSGSPSPPVQLNPPPTPSSPSVRLEAMTRERIVWLEDEHRRHREKIERLQGMLDRFAPENARLAEALKGAESNNVVSTILIGVGGGIISYATFTGKICQQLADIACGALLAGAFLMLIGNLRRWLGR